MAGKDKYTNFMFTGYLHKLKKTADYDFYFKLWTMRFQRQEGHNDIGANDFPNVYAWM